MLKKFFPDIRNTWNTITLLFKKISGSNRTKIELYSGFKNINYMEKYHEKFGLGKKN